MFINRPNKEVMKICSFCKIDKRKDGFYKRNDRKIGAFKDNSLVLQEAISYLGE